MRLFDRCERCGRLTMHGAVGGRIGQFVCDWFARFNPSDECYELMHIGLFALFIGAAAIGIVTCVLP